MLGERLRSLAGERDQLADGQDADGPVAAAQLPGEQTDTDLVLADLRRGAVGVPNGDGTLVGQFDRVVQHDLQLLRARRRQHAHARHLGQQRQVVHAVMAGAVVAGDAGAVEAEHDRQPVQGDVVDDLVPRPVQERAVDRHDRPQAAHGHPGRTGDGVLLGDADVEEAVGKAVLERDAARSDPGIAAVIATTRASAHASAATTTGCRGPCSIRSGKKSWAAGLT